jgi:hypothetical protein
MSAVLRRAFAAAGLVFLAPGCAHLDYVKVPTPTQYDAWTDDDQRKADDMEGVRYYLPRPFLHLKQSVPVSQRVAFVSFRYRPADEAARTEAGYYLELPDEAPFWLQRVAPERISVTQALAAVLMRADGADAGR